MNDIKSCKPPNFKFCVTVTILQILITGEAAELGQFVSTNQHIADNLILGKNLTCYMSEYKLVYILVAWFNFRMQDTNIIIYLPVISCIKDTCPNLSSSD